MPTRPPICRRPVFTVSPLLRELFVAAMRVPLDYAPATSDERLMRVLLDQLREIDVLPLHLPMPCDRRLARGARVVDVALDAGYASQSAFTAMFRKQFGMPPKAFYR